MTDADTDSDEVKDIIKQSKSQSRTNTEAATADGQSDAPDLDEAVAEALHAIDGGDLHENITLRDENLAALFQGLDETERLEDIQRDAEAAIERDEADVSTASAARALIRVGLQHVGEDVLSDARDGREKYILDKESDF